MVVVRPNAISPHPARGRVPVALARWGGQRDWNASGRRPTTAFLLRDAKRGKRAAEKSQRRALREGDRSTAGLRSDQNQSRTPVGRPAWKSEGCDIGAGSFTGAALGMKVGQGSTFTLKAVIISLRQRRSEPGLGLHGFRTKHDRYSRWKRSPNASSARQSPNKLSVLNPAPCRLSRSRNDEASPWMSSLVS